MIPVAQIPAAALASLILRGNLWIAAVSTLVSNPLTYGPLYYFAYRLGAGVIGAPVPAAVQASSEESPFAMLASLSEAWDWLWGIGQPLLLGMSIMAVTGAVVGYFGAQLFWRVRVLHKRRSALRARSLSTQTTGRGVSNP